MSNSQCSVLLSHEGLRSIIIITKISISTSRISDSIGGSEHDNYAVVVGRYFLLFLLGHNVGYGGWQLGCHCNVFLLEFLCAGLIICC